MVNLVAPLFQQSFAQWLLLLTLIQHAVAKSDQRDYLRISDAPSYAPAEGKTHQSDPYMDYTAKVHVFKAGKLTQDVTAIGGWIVHEAMQNFDHQDHLNRMIIRNGSATMYAFDVRHHPTGTKINETNVALHKRTPPVPPPVTPAAWNFFSIVFRPDTFAIVTTCSWVCALIGLASVTALGIYAWSTRNHDTAKNNVGAVNPRKRLDSVYVHQTLGNSKCTGKWPEDAPLKASWESLINYRNNHKISAMCANMVTQDKELGEGTSLVVWVSATGHPEVPARRRRADGRLGLTTRPVTPPILRAETKLGAKNERAPTSARQIDVHLLHYNKI